MRINLSLQRLFSYSNFIIVFLSIVTFFVAKKLDLIKFKLFKRKEQKKKAINIVEQKRIDVSSIKSKYLNMIDILLNNVDNNKIDTRKAYQELSALIRNFVFEVTNINVQNYTLEDIKNANIPILYDLVSDYYNPEFSYQSLGNIRNSIVKAREVIEKWKWDILYYFLLS